jgi:hypothetical protein
VKLLNAFGAALAFLAALALLAGLAVTSVAVTVFVILGILP